MVYSQPSTNKAGEDSYKLTALKDTYLGGENPTALKN